MKKLVILTISLIIFVGLVWSDTPNNEEVEKISNNVPSKNTPGTDLLTEGKKYLNLASKDNTKAGEYYQMAVDCFNRFIDDKTNKQQGLAGLERTENVLLLSDACYNLGLAYEKLQDWDKVASTFKNYRLNLAGDWVRVTDACMREGNADLQLGRREDAKAPYTLCAKAYMNIDPSQITLYDTDKELEPEQQEKRKQELLTMAKNSAAKASIYAADLFYDGYLAVKLSPESALASKFREKKERMYEVKTLLDQALSYKEPSIEIQAHYRLAKMYQEMAQSIINAEKPTGFDTYYPAYKIIYNMAIAISFNLTERFDLVLEEYCETVNSLNQRIANLTDEKQRKEAMEFRNNAYEEARKFAFDTGSMFAEWADELMVNVGDIQEGVRLSGGSLLDIDAAMALGEKFRQYSKKYYEDILTLFPLVESGGEKFLKFPYYFPPNSSDRQKKILKAVNQKISDINARYKEHLSLNPELKGVITIRFYINKNGEVCDADVESNETGDAAFADEILEIIKKLRFDTDGINTCVWYPFNFGKE